MSIKKRLLTTLLVIIVSIQFVRIDKSVPSSHKMENDFIYITQPAPEIKSLLSTICYDCHSYQTNYPWYSNIAPISWLIGHDIEEGREHLNFSEWGNYSAKKADHKLEECYEEVEEGEMPLDVYTYMHPSLNDEQKELLENWFKSLRK